MVRRRCRRVLLSLITAFALAGSTLAAGEDLSRTALAGDSPRTARRLAAADELAAHQQWAEAVDEYSRILTEAGDDLVSLDPRRALQARRVCHLRLAALPSVALQLYRNRVDSRAKKLFELGRTGRDPVRLRRLVDEAFCSRSTDRALDLLGDLAFEQGEFEEAERWWRMLALPASECGAPSAERGAPELSEKNSRAPRSALRPPALLYPDPQVDVARVRAKQILARLFRGERTDLQEEVKAFRALHAKAKGWLAGQEGLYAEILQKLAAERERLLAPTRTRDWSTFGGSPTRNLVVAKPPGRWAQLRPLDGPQWTVRLDAKDSVPTTESPRESAISIIPRAKETRSLPFHPVIQGNRVFVADGRRVLGYRLFDGRPILRYDLADYVALDQRSSLVRPGQDIAAAAERSYTLSVAGNRIYARLGAQGLGSSRKDRPRQTIQSYLVCLDLQFDGRAKVERWNVARKGSAAGGPIFEGAPVVGQGCVYIVESRFPGDQLQTAIDCYDADNGKLRWQTEVCSARQDRFQEHEQERSRQQLVTLAGGTLFYCSHAGAIVAVDALTGRRLWGIRYSSQAQKTVFGETPTRDLAPCVYAGCRLYVAPLDSDRLFCLDPDTGGTLWERGPLQVLQLLGVAKGRLIFTATTPNPCIRAVDAATGNDLRDWMQPADGSELKTFGRGLLAGDWVFWPIQSDLRRGVYVLNQETGEPVLFDERINGNLAVGNGCLAVAGVHALSLYIPERYLLQRRKEEAAQPGANAQTRYRLALAEADAGLFADALAALDGLEAHAADKGTTPFRPFLPAMAGASFRRLLGKRRHEILMDAAEQAEREKHWEQAGHFLTQAADCRFPRGARLTALAREAALWSKAGQPERAVAVWQSILEDTSLADSAIIDAHGNPQAAASFAAEQIAALIQEDGPRVYAAVERRARSLVSKTAAATRRIVLDRLGRVFPNALITGPALLELASRNEEAGEFGAAARAYRSFLRWSNGAAERPGALAGLARAYERQSCWPAARATWQQLAAEQGDRTVPALDSRCSVRAFVTLQLQRREYQSVAPARLPKLSLPLTRAWQSKLEHGDFAEDERFVPVAGSPWRGIGNEYLFAVGKGTIACREGSTGKPRWKATLPEPVTWIGCYADIVLAAGARSIHGLSRADGIRLWALSLAAGEDCRSHPSAFRLAGPRLFFLLDKCRLLALDVFSGRVLWSAWAPAARFRLPSPSGRFRAPYFAGKEILVIQTGTGQRLVFDCRTGRRLRTSLQAGQPWPRSPLPLDEHRLCLLTDPNHLTLLDSTTGRELWTYSVESPASLSGEALQILGRRDALLLLVSRNYGYFLECLDPRDGSRRWSKPRFLGTQPSSLEGGTLDDTAVYLVQKNALVARALADGRLLWKRPLPIHRGRWQLLRTQNCLLMLCREAQTIEWRFRWLFVTAGMQVTFPPAVLPQGCPCLLVCEPQTGKLLQRLQFPAAPARAVWYCRLQMVPSLAPRLGHHVLAQEELPVMQVSGQGLTVESAGKAWGLKAYTPNGERAALAP